MAQNYFTQYDEIKKVMADSPTVMQGIYEAWAKSDSMSDNELCFQLAVQLRKKGRRAEAFAVSKYLSFQKPSLKSYNMYLASAYDLLAANKMRPIELKNIFDEAHQFYQDRDFDPNITATLLKCCNKLIELGQVEQTRFYDIYRRCETEEQRQNSFIIAQHFKRLLADGEQQQILDLYNKLPQELQMNKSILYVRRACDNFAAPPHIIRSETRQSRRITLISNKKTIEAVKCLLTSFFSEIKLVDISSENLTDTLNQNTFRATTAILVMPVLQNVSLGDQFLWSFTIGYCVHKFSKNNIFLFVEGCNSWDDSHLAPFLQFLDAVSIDGDLDLLKKLGERGLISG